MPEYKAPGVYVEEVERGPKTIEGVSTSVAGFVGVAERGPLEPELVTSFADYQRLYGGYETDNDWEGKGANTNLPYAINGYFTNGGSRAYVTRVVPTKWIDESSDITAETTLGDGSNDVMTVTAIGPGFWGARVVVAVEDASSGTANRFKLRIGYWRNAGSFSASSYDTIKENKGRPNHEEVYDELSADKSASQYYETVVNGASSLVTVAPKNTGGQPQNGVTVLSLPASSPSDFDTDVSAGDYTGDAITGSKVGLQRFNAVDPITMVCAPDENKHDVRGSVIDHCEQRRDRIAIVGVSQGTDLDGFPQPSTGLRSEYAALYHPWLTVRDPETGLDRPVPPNGHIAGIYARSDAQHGVHKAPANEQVQGIQGLNQTITKGEQESLNPQGVNCIRSFRGRGIRVWGARTTSSDPSWKYVNVRRLFMFIEESIDEGTQWVVFENNDEELWARVRQTVGDFLTTLWEDGALMGSTPEEAFYVKCDRSTMTQNDIDNGRLICEIGIAPVKPAEFVVFRISQWTEGVEGGG